MVNTALPRIVADLGVGQAARASIVHVYPLALAVSIVVAARAGDRFGRKAMLLNGLGGYAVMNVVAAVSPNPLVLIGARALLGIGGALIVANVVSTIAVLYRGRARTVANGLWVATFGVANAVGPGLGGVLTQRVGWQAIFLVCVPIAAVGFGLTLWLVPETRESRSESWDLASVLTSAVALGAIVFGVQRTTTQAIAGIAITGVGVVLLVGFVRKQRRMPHPLVAVDLFARPGFGVAFVQLLVSAGASAASIYLVSVHLQDSVGMSPASVGVTLISQAAAIAVGGGVAPILSRVLSRGRTTALSLMAQAAGLGIVASLNYYVLGLALIGLGFGIVGTLCAAMLFDATPTSQLSHVGALQEIAFAVGSGVGVAVLGAVASAFGNSGFVWAVAVASGVVFTAALLPVRSDLPG
ncbi:putative drug resistance transporter [Gordonia effusa NBRC 100432]|uniref:Putative drug resistance transporter n=2 Tax=Gordonia effusa TaxID=263908 RepID=H0R3T7_9ACTN|nr:putative drug resistance transporter [Gordonia effusa NBRC 100432]